MERAHSWEEAKQEALQAKLDALLSERAFRLLMALSWITRWIPPLALHHSSDLPENAPVTAVCRHKITSALQMFKNLITCKAGV